MCTGIEIAMLVAAAAGTVAAVEQGAAQKDAANAQAQQALNQGAYAEDAAKAQAERIRRAGKAQRGEAKAALAGSGVKLSEGTPLEVDKTINVRSEEDALSAILSGKRTTQSASAEADFLGKKGDAAETNGFLSAGSTALGAYGKSGEWKTSATGHAQNLGYANGALAQE